MEKTIKHFELKETKNYNLFKFYEENRSINNKKVKEYKKSIKEKGLKQPINVKIENKCYKITDGQHRFMALTELGYSIIFLIDYDKNSTSEDIFDINANRLFTKTKDWIHYYATLEYPEYVAMKNIHTQYLKIKNTLLNEMFIISKKPKNPAYKITQSITQGTMKIDYVQGETILNWLNKIQDANGQHNLFQSKIVRALKHIYNNNKNFNINLFCKKISNNKKQILVENNEYKIVSNIKETYNKKQRNNELFLV